VIKSDIIKYVYSQHGYYTLQDIHEIVDAVFDVITEALEREEDVKILRFGKFKVSYKKERPGRNPRTGEPATVKARSVVTFKASKHLIKQINEVLGKS